MSVRRLSLVVLWVCVAHVAVTLTQRSLAPTRAVGSLMPAAGGEITELAIQFHRPRADLFLPVFGELLGALGPHTAVQVVVADREDQDIFDAAHAGWFPDGGGPVIRYAFVDRPITSWARDRLAVLPGDPSTVLLAPPAPMEGPGARISDWTVPWTLADALGDRFQVQSAPFQFEGGDLIADEDRAYVATPLLDRNPDLELDALLHSIEATVGRPVLALGADGEPVPDHHIGMFLTPLSSGRVAVGDPMLGHSLLPTGPLLVGGHPFEPQTSPDVLARFASVAAQLEAEGLEVVRMPLVPSTVPYAWLSYNNVLMEHREGGLHVYLPTYGVRALDDAAVEVWRSLGAHPHPIPVSELFWQGGSVRCLTAPLARRSVE